MINQIKYSCYLHLSNYSLVFEHILSISGAIKLALFETLFLSIYSDRLIIIIMYHTRASSFDELHNIQIQLALEATQVTRRIQATGFAACFNQRWSKRWSIIVDTLMLLVMSHYPSCPVALCCLVPSFSLFLFQCPRFGSLASGDPKSQ